MVYVYGTTPPDLQFLVNPFLIKTVCILLVMLPVSSPRNIASLEKVTTGQGQGEFPVLYTHPTPPPAPPSQFSGIAVFLVAGLQLFVLYEIIVLFCAV